MRYTNKEVFILSATGCMGTERDGLESVLAGNDEGARGCCLSVDMTSDGIAVLASDGCCMTADGVIRNVSDFTYAELHQTVPQLMPAGQAIDLARAFQCKIAITVHNQALLPQLRMTLRQADYLDDTIFVGLGLVEAARIANANPDLHIIGELPTSPDSIDALVRAAQTTGLFGLRAAPAILTPQLVRACREAGLFTMSLPTSDERTLEYLVRNRINFIETKRPDLAALFLPDSSILSHHVPLQRY